MMSTIGIVCRKEVLETARDKRTLFVLLLGPLIGPMLFVVLINFIVSQNLTSIEQPLIIPIAGAERTPNLIAFLKARGVQPLEGHGLTGIEDAARFRQTVLDVIPRLAGPLVARFDSGPGFNDPVGRFRQESYCFDLRGKPAWILLSTSSGAMQKASMQVSVSLDREDTCRGKLPVPPAITPP